ncbi:MAG: hypothetical protein ACRDFB_08815 [Rhabdochlamydiaceae bacterium]
MTTNPNPVTSGEWEKSWDKTESLFWARMYSNGLIPEYDEDNKDYDWIPDLFKSLLSHQQEVMRKEVKEKLESILDRVRTTVVGYPSHLTKQMGTMWCEGYREGAKDLRNRVREEVINPLLDSLEEENK